MEQIKELSSKYMRGPKLVTMSSVVPARTCGGHALALPPHERHKLLAQLEQQNRVISSLP